MSDFLLAEGFGNLKDGTHTAGVDREILGSQWLSYAANFAIEDRADGRKWIKSPGGTVNVELATKPWANITAICIGMRVLRGTAAAHTLVRFWSGGNTVGVLFINASGALAYGRTPTAGVVVATDTIAEGSEAYVEASLQWALGATSTVKFWVNGVASGEHTAIDTTQNGSSVDAMILFGSGSGYSGLLASWKFGDIVMHTGTPPVGDVGVYYLPADEDGADADFTPSAGADHYAMVDEIGPDGDTTYNESDGTVGHRDGYLTAGISGLTILSVGALARLRKTDTGTSAVKLGVLYNLDESQGAAVGLSETYGSFVDFFDVNPDTAAAWLAAQIATTAATVEVQ